jgi:hypothetical protein
MLNTPHRHQSMLLASNRQLLQSLSNWRILRGLDSHRSPVTPYVTQSTSWKDEDTLGPCCVLQEAWRWGFCARVIRISVHVFWKLLVTAGITVAEGLFWRLRLRGLRSSSIHVALLRSPGVRRGGRWGRTAEGNGRGAREGKAGLQRLTVVPAHLEGHGAGGLAWKPTDECGQGYKEEEGEESHGEMVVRGE